MQLFRHDRTYDFMATAKYFLLLSLALIAGSMALLFTKNLNYGIDFAGGTVVQVRYQQAAPIDTIRSTLTGTAFEKASIQEFGAPEEVVIKIPDTSANLGEDIGDVMRKTLAPTGEFEIRRVDMVGPKVGAELREKGLTALAIAIIGVLIYVAFRFEWRFALASIAALVHDIAITVGAIVLFQIDVNLEILAALLTILGYSLNDTIVVFDRIREGFKTSRESDLTSLINESVSRTLSRTTLTSLTTFFVVLTLFLFGGELISGLSLTLMVGIIVGTYSSIFIAANMLRIMGFSVRNWREKEAKKEALQKEKDRMRAMYEQGTL